MKGFNVDKITELSQVIGYDNRVITVGSRVVYPGRQSSRVYINDGIVKAIQGVEPEYGNPYTQIKVARRANDRWEQDGRIVTVVELQRVVPLSYFPIAKCSNRAKIAHN